VSGRVSDIAVRGLWQVAQEVYEVLEPENHIASVPASFLEADDRDLMRLGRPSGLVHRIGDELGKMLSVLALDRPERVIHVSGLLVPGSPDVALAA
jgi:hypothetical protein